MTQSAPAHPPRHVAIIMDGNGRWANARGLPRTAGHKQGVEALRGAVRTASDTRHSVSDDLQFQCRELVAPASRSIVPARSAAPFHTSGRRRTASGQCPHPRHRRPHELDSDIIALLEHSERLTKDNTGLTLIVAFNYGSRQEIARAARDIAMAVKSGLLEPDAITPELIGSHLDTVGIPDPDLLIRTSGEQRISNYLLWQCAYTEFVFVSEHWPDFTRETFEQAIAEFRRRERRFGGLAAQTA